MGKTALIAGASGQVGGYLLALLLQSDTYDKVISIGRKNLEITNPKLQQIIVDFDNPDTLKIEANDVFCCLGTTIKKAKTKERFRQVDYGYPMALARETLAAGATRFMVISSMGSALDSAIFYAKVKAEMERDLSTLPFISLGIFKPSMLLGPRKEFRFGELIGKFFMQVFAFIIPIKYKGVHAATVAKAMLHYANSTIKGTQIILNAEILANK